MCIFTFSEIIPSILGGPRAEYDIIQVDLLETVFNYTLC